MHQPISRQLKFFASHPIPTLPLLENIVGIIKNNNILPNLNNTMIIGVQHMLETTVSLFDALISLGINPNNMYFSGKIYSTAPEIAQEVTRRGINLIQSERLEKLGEYEDYVLKNIAKMWEIFVRDIANRSVDRIIILDEGGRCIETMPTFIGINYNVAAIEQTQAGLNNESINHIPFPLIEVASSAVKKVLEPSLIATTIIKKLEKLFENIKHDEYAVFGVVGNGAIGNAISEFLLRNKYKVIVYDENPNVFENIQYENSSLCRFTSILDLISNCDFILGCTGKDITKGIDVLKMKKSKVFISCTSEDKEFLSLLKNIAKQNRLDVDPLADITYTGHYNNKITILRGGFPFNFDRKAQSVPSHQIEITRAALLGGLIEAIMIANKPVNDTKIANKGRRQMLNPTIQSYIATHWLPRQTHIDEHTKLQLITVFSDEKWIEKNSGGMTYQNLLINQAFDNICRKNTEGSNFAKL